MDQNFQKWHWNFSMRSGFKKNASHTKIPMPFLSSLDNLLEDAYIIFQKSVDNFAIEHQTC